MRNGTRVTVGNFPFQTLDVAGQPGAGVLAGTSVAAGVVPTDATAGCPKINAFTGANKGHLFSVGFGNSVTCRLRLYDMLFKAGAYPFNAAQTLAAQPSYSSRVPGGTDFNGTQIWVEAVTAFTGTPTFTVTYTNQDGVTGRTTGAVAGILGTGAPTVGRMGQMPLQAGDTGVQVIETVTATIATVGTFNVLVLRPLWGGRVASTNYGDVHGPVHTGMVELFDTSAIIATVTTDLVALGIPEILLTIVNG